MNPKTFQEAACEVIKDNGIETLRRWSEDSNPIIANMFKRCLQEGGAQP